MSDASKTLYRLLSLFIRNAPLDKIRGIDHYANCINFEKENSLRRAKGALVDKSVGRTGHKGIRVLGVSVYHITIYITWK